MGDEKNGPDNIVHLLLITILGSVITKDSHGQEEAINMNDINHIGERHMKHAY